MRLRLMALRHPLRYLPTGLTIGNCLCGFGAILHTLHVYYDPAGEPDVPRILAGSAWLIMGAMIFDMLDGWSARKLNASSEHGIEMDSLADMVTFGVAPAVLVAVMAHIYEVRWLAYPWVWVMSAVFLACVALRLALYNVLARAPDKQAGGGFHGLPSPGGAAAVCSVVILNSSPEFEYKVLAELLPIYAAVLGFLMVSPFPYGHVGHWLGSKRHYKRKVLLLIAFFGFFTWDSRLAVAIIVNAYVLTGPLNAVREWWLTRGNGDDEPAPTGKGGPP